MGQRRARSKRLDASGVNSPKVLSVKFSSVITIISAMKWSYGLDTRFGKSPIACHLLSAKNFRIGDHHLSKFKEKMGKPQHFVYWQIGKLHI